MTWVYKEYKVEKKEWYNSNDSNWNGKNELFIGSKQGNSYWVDGQKKVNGDSTKGEFFFVIGERMSKFSASVGLLLFSCYSRGNLAIWSQFGPRLQNLISHDFL